VERRFAVHASALALTLAVIAGSAEAAPKKRAAKLQFQKGLTAYQKGNYDQASAAFERSFKLEADQDTLFAWAQSERKLEHCTHATELYTKLLAMKLPAANRAVVEQQLGECTPPAATTPTPTPTPAVEPEPAPAEPPPPAATPAPAPLPQLHDDSPLAQPSDTGEVDHRAWYADPVGDGLAVVGIGGLATGAAFLVTARSDDQRAHASNMYTTFQSLESSAHSRGETGVIALGAGVAFVAAAVVWYVVKD
jgi:tetratricopeptide (TPR) repeat protein